MALYHSPESQTSFESIGLSVQKLTYIFKMTAVLAVLDFYNGLFAYIAYSLYRAMETGCVRIKPFNATHTLLCWMLIIRNLFCKI